MKSIKDNLKRATVEMVLLSLLCEKDMYGYEIAQELKKRSNYEYSLLEGSMYPILYRLTENGDIVGEERLTGKRMVRIYYSITDTGRVHLKEMTDYFNRYLSIINELMGNQIEMNKISES